MSALLGRAQFSDPLARPTVFLPLERSVIFSAVSCADAAFYQIGGALAQQPIAAQPDYYASMAARHNLAVSLARELKESGIT